MAIGGPGVFPIPFPIQKPIDSHGETSGKDHAQQDPESGGPSESNLDLWDWRGDNPSPKGRQQGKRKCKNGVAKPDEF
jgi:hypothetical protein